MKGLIIKDLCNMKSYGKQYGIVMLFMIAWGILMKNASLISMYAILLGGLLVLTSISLDEMVHFEKLLFTMPVSRKQYVLSKYLLLLILIGAGILLASAVSLLQSIAAGESFAESIMFLIPIAGVFALTYAVTFPVIFKKGVEKARYVYIFVMLAIGAAIFGMVKLAALLGVDLNALDEQLDPYVLAAGIVLFCIAALFVSYRFSVSAIMKREWE